MQPNTYSPAMLELHIEELVLHGFPVAQRMSIGDAVQQELQRLLTEQGLDGFAVGPVNIERINGGMFRVARGARPETVGSQLARQIHQQFPQRQKASPSGKQPKGAKSAR
jgi:hypothetical protein